MLFNMLVTDISYQRIHFSFGIYLMVMPYKRSGLVKGSFSINDKQKKCLVATYYLLPCCER